MNQMSTNSQITGSRSVRQGKVYMHFIFGKEQMNRQGKLPDLEDGFKLRLANIQKKKTTLVSSFDFPVAAECLGNSRGSC